MLEAVNSIGRDVLLPVYASSNSSNASCLVMATVRADTTVSQCAPHHPHQAGVVTVTRCLSLPPQRRFMPECCPDCLGGDCRKRDEWQYLLAYLWHCKGRCVHP